MATYKISARVVEYIRKVHKDERAPLEKTRVLEEAAEESLLPFRSWLSVFAQAYEALELLHYLYEAAGMIDMRFNGP